MKYSEFQYFQIFSPKVILLLRNCPNDAIDAAKINDVVYCTWNILQKQILVIAELLRPEYKAQKIKDIVSGHV